MTRFHYTSLLTILTFLFAFYFYNSPRKPHIIIIIADDVGWNDFSFHGSNQILTPNIDALGYNGVILNRFYTQHACSPSRAALLTGNYPIRTGLQGMPIRAGTNFSLPTNIPLLPQLLKDLGYSTNLIGKWHLGFAYKKDTPINKGFDYHFGYWNGYIGYFNYIHDQQLSKYVGFDFYENLSPKYQYNGQYVTNLFTEKALEVINGHKNRKGPLFLVVSHLAGHTGENGTELGVPNITLTNIKYNYIKEESRRRYADIINIMDDSVGQIVKKLADKNMLHDSIIIFLSDNGAPVAGELMNSGSNWPLRGSKLSLFEGSLKGSCVIFSPLLNKQQYVNNELIHISDLLPTIYSASGGKLNKIQKIDGINQWSTLSNNVKTLRSEILLNIDERLNVTALIDYNGRYKLINGESWNGVFNKFYGESARSQNNPQNYEKIVLNSITNKVIRKIMPQTQIPLNYETIKNLRQIVDLINCRPKIEKSAINCKNFCLFDLIKDPCETNNIINEKPLIAKRMKRKLLQFYKEIVPQPPKYVNPRSNPTSSNNTWTNWAENL